MMLVRQRGTSGGQTEGNFLRKDGEVNERDAGHGSVQDFEVLMSALAG